MSKDKKPVHGQIRIDEEGRTFIYADESASGNPLKSDTITPDSVRDKELKDLRRKLRKANYISWILFVLGLIIGGVISWALIR